MKAVLLELRRERRRRRRLEVQLSASERQLKEVQQLAGTGDWEFDLTNDQIRWSEETFRIFGIDSGVQEPDFADILLSIHPDDAPVFDRAIQKAVTIGESDKLDLRIRCADGARRSATASRPWFESLVPCSISPSVKVPRKGFFRRQLTIR